MSGTSHIVLIDVVDILFFIVIILFSVVKCEYDFHQKIIIIIEMYDRQKSVNIIV